MSFPIFSLMRSMTQSPYLPPKADPVKPTKPTISRIWILYWCFYAVLSLLSIHAALDQEKIPYFSYFNALVSMGILIGSGCFILQKRLVNRTFWWMVLIVDIVLAAFTNLEAFNLYTIIGGLTWVTFGLSTVTLLIQLPVYWAMYR